MTNTSTVTEAQSASRSIPFGAGPGGDVEKPEFTAAAVALFRAQHVQVDAPPHVLEDEVGLQLLAPDDGWRELPGMDPLLTREQRAMAVARSRYVEDLVAEHVARGVGQYLILGAGIDTFFQRRPELSSQLQVFEVDEPGPQVWKRRRLLELGFGVPDRLHLVPSDFENGAWWDELAAAGFDVEQPAVVTWMGVSQYVTKEANAVTLARIASCAPDSTLAMTFALPMHLLGEEDRQRHQRIESATRAGGTPQITFYEPTEMIALAHAVGFRDVQQFATSDLDQRYFVGRTDGLRQGKRSQFLVATT